MNVLVIGSGGREHALCWKIKQSTLVKRLYCAPGNGGIAQIAECADIRVDDVELLLQFALRKKIDLTIVGPEISLVAGIVDAFAQKGLKIFGPSQAAAELEGSKVFAKEFMHRRNIPTAIYKIFDDSAIALAFLKEAQFPLVVKADGIAAGKGVYVCSDLKQAKAAVDEIMVQKIFGPAGDRIVIEECLQGPEVSVLAICDGKHFFVLPTAQDHKRIFDDDLGPNTGGMGTFSPSPLVTVDVLDQIISRIIEPTIRGMYQEGNPFKGILFAGLMLTVDGPKALEFNVRFGDPETQSILPRLQSDIVEMFLAACDGRLHEIKVRWDEQACVCVVIASGGYPGKYQNGFAISGLDQVKDQDTIVFHAGTKNDGGNLVTSGGRVLGVTSLGSGLAAAATKAYNAVSKIEFDHMFFRRDIGTKVLKKSLFMAATKVLKVNSALPEPEKMAEAARIVRQGGLVIFPTETVYGIAADSNNPKAMDRLRAVKKRTDGKLFSILVAHRGIIDNYSTYTHPNLYKVIDKYWPGPLTVIVPARHEGETIGIRMPDHTVALRLVEESGCTIAAPSANLEGKKPPTNCHEALIDLDGQVELALDGGPVDFGISSTILDFTMTHPTVTRDGVITQPDVDRTINRKCVLFVCTGNSCRSVMAEYLLKAKLIAREDVEVHSAGTSVFFKSAASQETIAVLRERGINVAAHISRPLGSIMLKKSDLIFAMTRAHRAQILERVPSVEKRVYLLKEFGNTHRGFEADLDVPDPIGQPHAAYQECLVTINEAIEKIEGLL